MDPIQQQKKEKEDKLSLDKSRRDATDSQCKSRPYK